jgi:hypothetical protein
MKNPLLLVSMLLPTLSLACEIIPVGFINQLPAGTKVTIEEVQAKVTYKDGSTESFGPRRTNIVPGGADEVFMTACTDKCVKSIYGKMTLRDTQAAPKQVVREKTFNADPPTMCMAIGSFRLGKD